MESEWVTAQRQGHYRRELALGESCGYVGTVSWRDKQEPRDAERRAQS